MNTSKLEVGDQVKCLRHPKYKNTHFKGDGFITSICGIPAGYCWVEWYDQGMCNGLIKLNELIKTGTLN